MCRLVCGKAAAGCGLASTITHMRRPRLYAYLQRALLLAYLCPLQRQLVLQRQPVSRCALPPARQRRQRFATPCILLHSCAQARAQLRAALLRDTWQHGQLVRTRFGHVADTSAAVAAGYRCDICCCDSAPSQSSSAAAAWLASAQAPAPAARLPRQVTSARWMRAAAAWHAVVCCVEPCTVRRMAACCCMHAHAAPGTHLQRPQQRAAAGLQIARPKVVWQLHQRGRMLQKALLHVLAAAAGAHRRQLLHTAAHISACCCPQLPHARTWPSASARSPAAASSSGVTCDTSLGTHQARVGVAAGVWWQHNWGHATRT